MPAPPEQRAFTLFPLLATELRLKIWQHACLERTVTVRYDLERDQCFSSSAPPAILQACRESREEALKVFRLCFGTHTKPAKIYFNPYRDTLYLPRYRQMGYDETLRDFRILIEDTEGILNDVSRVAIEHVDPVIKRPWESYNKATLLRGFQKLDEVILVSQYKKSEKVGLDEEIEFVEPKEDPVELLKLWVDFRRSVVLEERELETVCKDMDREYSRWSLPTVRIRSKVRNR